MDLELAGSNSLGWIDTVLADRRVVDRVDSDDDMCIRLAAIEGQQGWCDAWHTGDQNGYDYEVV